MRYEMELEVDVPRERLVELFLDQDNLMKWQPDLLSVKVLSGEPGEVGTKTMQVNRQGKRTLDIIETITVMNPPEEFCATYEAGPVWNLIENRFHELGDGRTRWLLVSDFQSTSIMMKLMTVFLRGMFKKQTWLFMNRAKEFVESAA